MAINIKQIVADAMLDLCRTKELKAITIKDIREKTGVSRQGFYSWNIFPFLGCWITKVVMGSSVS